MANSGKTLQTRIQLKHDTEANWKTAGTNGFKPLAGELIIYDDTIGGAKIKIGNGEDTVNELSFIKSMHYIPADLFTVTAGSSTSGAYLAAKWKISDLDGITQPYDGLTIALRTPATGYSGGILLSIDNGANYYPLVRNISTLITTNYGANATVILTFNETQTAKPYLTDGVQTEVTGCWQTADYDANSYAYVRQYYTTANNSYPLLFKYDAGISTTTNYVTKYTRYGNKMYANPSTGTITSTKLVLTGPSTSANQTLLGINSTGELVKTSKTITPSGTVAIPNIAVSVKDTSGNALDPYSITGVGTLPSATFSQGTLPSASLSKGTLPSLTFSAGSLPSLTFNAGSLPSLTFGAGTLPTQTCSYDSSTKTVTISFSQGTLPSASLSQGTLPSATFSAGTLPSATFSAGTLPSLTFSAGTLPSLTFSAGTLPTRTKAVITATHSGSATFTGTAITI